MSIKALSVTPVSFEKLFAAPATQRTLAGRCPYGTIAKDWTDWREIAGEALRRKKLGGALRRAIGSLSAEFREVLFLQDVKNLDTAETAWVLDLPVEAVRSRLRKARTQVRHALALALFPKRGQKNPRCGYSFAHGAPSNLAVFTRRNSFSLA